MAGVLCERLYTRSWLCLGILFLICIAVNMIVFMGSLSLHPFHFLKSPIYYPSQSTPVYIPNADSQRVSSNTSQDITSAEQKYTEVKHVVKNPHDYKYLINEPSLCESDYELLIVVCTAAKNFKERETIRKTWGSKNILQKTETNLVFLLGSVDSENIQKRLLNESDRYRDIIQEDFVDSYRNLSLKSVALLKWVCRYCQSSSYVLKVDDDMYINIPNLLKALTHIPDSKFILGCVFEGAKPVQDKKSKWHTPLEDFSEKIYPKYVSGTAYAMSTSCIPNLFTAALQIQTFWLEDVYITGLLARKAGIPRIHSPKFNFIKIPVSGCAFRNLISGHGYTSDELSTIHQQLYSSNLKCKK